MTVKRDDAGGCTDKKTGSESRGEDEQGNAKKGSRGTKDEKHRDANERDERHVASLFIFDCTSSVHW
jgi:hypothetical protein